MLAASQAEAGSAKGSWEGPGLGTRTFCLRVSTALLPLAQKVTVRSVMQSVR